MSDIQTTWYTSRKRQHSNVWSQHLTLTQSPITIIPWNIPINDKLQKQLVRKHGRKQSKTILKKMPSSHLIQWHRTCKIVATDWQHQSFAQRLWHSNTANPSVPCSPGENDGARAYTQQQQQRRALSTVISLTSSELNKTHPFVRQQPDSLPTAIRVWMNHSENIL